RNALINNFNTLKLRNDVGELWENYLATERIKSQHYKKQKTHTRFWRTYDQQELDWVEERGDQLSGFEFKWNAQKKAKIPVAFAKAYPDATFEVITPNNYLNFIT